MGRKDKERSDHLHDFLVEEILAGGDDDDIDAAEIAEFRAVVASGKVALARRRLQMAKEAVLKDKQHRSNVTEVDKERARKRLSTIKTSANDDGASITLAARFGKDDMNDDVDGLLEDLAELERDRKDD
ncbi:hypothetical protein [Mesorhizobium sp.]|uniref:hypothetical protein n=1 Tax=Mesorhizobium sp. TaxID=1871066 RepID=UPI0011FB7B8D|nr:hypothetical protein [Mesorhizobium sp.]TJV17982.1 MAG: hypothetical protein E5Y07_10010 [Mesorhizobium sp.]